MGSFAFSAFDERTDAQTERANIVDIIDFEDSEILIVTAKERTNFVENKSIGTTAKRGEFDKMQVAIWMITNKMSRFENAIRICPLRERIDFVED